MADQAVFLTPEQDLIVQEVCRRVLGSRRSYVGRRAGLVNQTVPQLLGKATEAIAKGESGEVEVWEGLIQGEETASGQNVEVYNRFRDVAEGAWVWAISNGASLEIVRDDVETIRKGVLDEALTQTGTATLSLWDYNTEDEVEEDTGEDIEVSGWLLQTGFEFSSGDHIFAVLQGGRWYAIQSRECPEEV